MRESSFLACPGIRREAEIVANEIWSIVRNNEKLAANGNAERIRFHEIAVLIPDSAVDDYVAQIDSVFRKQHRIPIDLVSRSIAGASRVAEAVDLLLEVAERPLLARGNDPAADASRVEQRKRNRNRYREVAALERERWEFSSAPTTTI